MDKVVEPRYLALFLDVIAKYVTKLGTFFLTVHRICVRSEFDCENLTLRSPPEFIHEFRRYRKLMQLTFQFICNKLVEGKPLPITATLSYQLVRF
jgi:hypothetical protein